MGDASFVDLATRFGELVPFAAFVVSLYLLLFMLIALPAVFCPGELGERALAVLKVLRPPPPSSKEGEDKGRDAKDASG